MNSKTIIFIVVIILVAASAGLFLLQQKRASEPQNKPATSNVSNGVFELKLKNYNGETISLADFKGKPLVINSWAAWCPFCRKELVDFATAQKEFGDEVIIIAIDRAETKETAKKYSDELGVTNDMVFLLDPADSFYQSIGGFSMPETIFVYKNGNTVFHKRGPMDVKEIRERVRTLLLGAAQETSQNSISPEKEEIPSQSELVIFNGSSFSPKTLRIKSGTIVTFRNESPNPMWVASDPHPIHTNYSGFDARKSMSTEEIYSFTFTQKGSWGYHNHLNPGQVGEIIVE